MSQTERFMALIPAAGVGSRFGADIPKQYSQLHGRTVLDTSINAFIEREEIEKIVVVLHPQDTYWNESEFVNHPKVMTTTGGDERSGSVLNGCRLISETYGNDCFVLVHDAARPCVSPKEITRLIEAVKNHGQGAILCTPIFNTVKQKAGDQIKTLNRSMLWQALTPQVFSVNHLLRALNFTSKNELAVTDEANAIEQIGLPYQMVLGHQQNIKITTKEDLALAEFFLHREN